MGIQSLDHPFQGTVQKFSGLGIFDIVVLDNGKSITKGVKVVVKIILALQRTVGKDP
jgi:hypothetical protein